MVRLQPDARSCARRHRAQGEEARPRPRHPVSGRLQPGRQGHLYRPAHAEDDESARARDRHRPLSHLARRGREDPDRSARPALSACPSDRHASRGGGGARRRHPLARLRPLHAEIRQADRRRAAHQGAGRSRPQALSRRARFRPAAADGGLRRQGHAAQRDGCRQARAARSSAIGRSSGGTCGYDAQEETRPRQERYGPRTKK